MSEFEEYWKDYEGSSDYVNSRYSCAEDAYTAAQEAWYFQQGEVNKLQTEIDELQARIDATEKWIESNKKNIPLSEWHGYTTEEYVDADDLLEILKGNKDEN